MDKLIVGYQASPETLMIPEFFNLTIPISVAKSILEGILLEEEPVSKDVLKATILLTSQIGEKSVSLFKISRKYVKIYISGLLKFIKAIEEDIFSDSGELNLIGYVTLIQALREMEKEYYGIK